jgi:hypothetical protein
MEKSRKLTNKSYDCLVKNHVCSFLRNCGAERGRSYVQNENVDEIGFLKQDAFALHLLLTRQLQEGNMFRRVLTLFRS